MSTSAADCCFTCGHPRHLHLETCMACRCPKWREPRLGDRLYTSAEVELLIEVAVREATHGLPVDDANVVAMRIERALRAALEGK